MFTIIFNDGSYQELPYAKTFKDAKAEMFLRFTKAEAKEKDASLIWDADEGDNIFVVETINQDGQGDVFYELARSWESAVDEAAYNMEYNSHNVCRACKVSDFDEEWQMDIIDQLLYQ